MIAKLTQLTPFRICIQIQGIPQTVFYEFTEDSAIDLANVNLTNFLVLAAFPFAMKKGLDLEIPGTIDAQLARNLEQYSFAWHQYRPNLFKCPVRVIADEYKESCPMPGADYIAAYSGGFDSSYTLVDLATKNKCSPWPRVSNAVMIDGFGFNLAKKQQYIDAFNRGKIFCADLGITLMGVRTNWAKIVVWYQIFHTMGIAAIQNLYSARHAGGYIGLDFTYSEEFILGPWGNMAMLDRILSSSNFPIIPHGGEASRIEKICSLHEAEQDLNITVCNASERSSQNCGLCEKCIRTMLAYRCQNLQVSDQQFSSRLNIDMVSSIEITKRTQWIFYRKMEHLWQDRSDPFLKAIQRVIKQAEDTTDF